MTDAGGGEVVPPRGDRKRTRERPAWIGTRLRHTMEYALLRILLLPVGLVGWRGRVPVGRFLGSVTFSVLRIRRRVTLRNLAHAFPDWPEKRRLEVAGECYRNFGVTFLELCLMPLLDPRLARTIVRVENPGQYRDARLSGRGAVLATGHFGNWEMLGAAVAASGYPTWALVRRQRNGRVDSFVTKSRESTGLRTLYTDRALFGVPRALRRGEFVAIAADQDAGPGGVFIPFLGRPASTPDGIVRFARRTGAPIIPGFGVRQPDGTYLLEMPGPMWVRSDLPSREAELEALTRFTSLLEERIRRHPEQWFWMHRRWKTRPPVQAGPSVSQVDG